jgi:dTDP-L-rhamnose 4-epimerase
VALRFFNIYGSRQALSNPYTGVAAIFSSRILSGQPPVIFEDGLQQRDFVHVSDVVQACRLAMDSPAADNQALNVGSGRPVTVLKVAETLAATLAWQRGFDIRRKFRAGDIRHCFADVSRIQRLLGYAPRYAFEDGVTELVRWVAEQQGVADRLAEATRELSAYGLVR